MFIFLNIFTFKFIDISNLNLNKLVRLLLTAKCDVQKINNLTWQVFVVKLGGVINQKSRFCYLSSIFNIFSWVCLYHGKLYILEAMLKRAKKKGRWGTFWCADTTIRSARLSKQKQTERVRLHHTHGGLCDLYASQDPPLYPYIKTAVSVL